MTHAEVVRLWVPYMRKRGTLHTGMRLDQGFALLATIINNALGGKAKQQDYMPYAEQRAASISDVMNILISGKDR